MCMKVAGYTASQMFLPDICNRRNQRKKETAEARGDFSLEKLQEQPEKREKPISEEKITSRTDTDIIVTQVFRAEIRPLTPLIVAPQAELTALFNTSICASASCLSSSDRLLSCERSYRY